LSHPLVTVLRDKKTSIEEFRSAADNLSTYLSHLALEALDKVMIDVETPLGKTKGIRFTSSIVLVPVLRAGLAMLPQFLNLFPSSRVGMVGLQRDEKTHQAKWYYEKLPKISSSDQVFLLDPMLATGGSSVAALELLTERGVKTTQIIAIHMVSAPDGVQLVQERFPGIRLVIVQQDEKLTAQKFIYPGLGDFGDRYFGTEG